MVDTQFKFKTQVAEARRTQILWGAAQVFAKKGFHKATTKEIAKAAGVSEGTIYNYFDNKRDLLFAMIDLLGIQSFKEVGLEQPPDDPIAFLSAILHNRYQVAEDYGHILAPIMAELISDADLREAFYERIINPIFSLMERYIQQQVDTGKFRSVNPVIMTRSMIGMLMVNATFKLSGLDPKYDNISVDEMIEEIVSIFLGGVLLPD